MFLESVWTIFVCVCLFVTFLSFFNISAYYLVCVLSLSDYSFLPVSQYDVTSLYCLHSPYSTGTIAYTLQPDTQLNCRWTVRCVTYKRLNIFRYTMSLYGALYYLLAKNCFYIAPLGWCWRTQENPGVGPLPRQVEIWKLICSFLDVSLRHPPC